jgi:hypothetical protein
MVAIGQQGGRAVICAGPHSVDMVSTSVKMAAVHSQSVLEHRLTSKHYLFFPQAEVDVVDLKGRLGEVYLRQAVVA